MTYKPKFCCECGVPIERTNWTLLTSRRFCELCEIDYKVDEWIPRAAFVIAILFGIFGLGTFLQKAEKPLNTASAISANINKTIVNTQSSTVAGAQFFTKTQETNLAVEQSALKPSNTLPKQDSKIQKAENKPREIEETTYFCGAETKKGMPCTRRVRGGGRCWQHAGKSAILPPEKLVASR
jgi:hypothetical protein